MKNPLRSFVQLMAFGVAAYVLYHVALIAVALGLALILRLFLETEYLILCAFCYLGLRVVLELPEMFGTSAVCCPQCKRAVRTSLPVKCEECGGAALLVKRRKREPRG